MIILDFNGIHVKNFDQIFRKDVNSDYFSRNKELLPYVLLYSRFGLLWFKFGPNQGSGMIILDYNGFHVKNFDQIFRKDVKSDHLTHNEELLPYILLYSRFRLIWFNFLITLNCPLITPSPITLI
jgi:hypothetical protein